MENLLQTPAQDNTAPLISDKPKSEPFSVTEPPAVPVEAEKKAEDAPEEEKKAKDPRPEESAEETALQRQVAELKQKLESAEAAARNKDIQLTKIRRKDQAPEEIISELEQKLESLSKDDEQQIAIDNLNRKANRYDAADILKNVGFTSSKLDGVLDYIVVSDAENTIAAAKAVAALVKDAFKAGGAAQKEALTRGNSAAPASGPVPQVGAPATEKAAPVSSAADRMKQIQKARTQFR